jgi:hypothetical protein
MPYLRSCNLFFRSARGGFRLNCSHRHLATQEASTVLVASEIAAGDDDRFYELNKKLIAQQVQMSELHERLAAQEVLTKSLLVSISKLGCKQGNSEASFNRHLEPQNIKLSGAISCLSVGCNATEKQRKS